MTRMSGALSANSAYHGETLCNLRHYDRQIERCDEGPLNRYHHQVRFFLEYQARTDSTESRNTIALKPENK